MNRPAATASAEDYLKRLDLWEHKDKKLNALSRGMHQKAQFIVTVMHDPDLVIVDEPFSGLDPVNTELIRDILGPTPTAKAIIMSTHQMHQVDSICDQIVLINEGQVVLSGTVNAVRRQFAGNTVEVSGQGDFAQLPQVENAEHKNGVWRLTLTDETTPQSLLRTCSS